MSEIISTYTHPETGHTIDVYASGAERDTVTNRLIKAPPSASITKERSAEFAQRRRELGIHAQMRGLAKSTGVELSEDATLDDIAQHAANAVEGLTEYFARTFQQSKNLRGMAESYNKLTAPLLGDERTPAPTPPTLIQNNLNVSAGEALKFIQDVIASKLSQKDNVVDGEAADAPAWLHGGE